MIAPLLTYMRKACAVTGYCHVMLAVMFAVTAIVMTAGQAEARPTSGYDLNSSPPSFSNYPRNSTPAADEEVPDSEFSFFRQTNDQGLANHYTANGVRKNIALQQICSDGYLTERIVNCLRRIIDGAVQDFLTEFQLALNGFMLALITLAVTLFGGKILLGVVERPGQEAFTLLLKIGAVLLFTNSLGGFLPMVFPVMESMAGYGMSYIGAGDSSAFLQSCSEAGGFDASIWRKIDCIMQRIFTGGDVADDPTYRVGILWVLAVAILWTSFIGFFVFAMMFSVFLMIFLLVIRCVYVFLAAYAFLALLIVISPLIIPLVLFQNTVNYYNKWWRQFLSMIIQPMLLFAYMAFVFAMIDSMFFQDNEYSLASILGANWEEPQVTRGIADDDLAEMMRSFEEDTGFQPGDPEYIGHQRMLEDSITYTGIGVVQLREERLIDIELTVAQDIVDSTHVGDLPVVGGVIEDGASLAATAIDKVSGWALDKVEDWLIPFKVIRVHPEGRTRWGFMMDILKFFIVVLVFMPLLMKFTKDLPRLVQYLSSAIRTPGSVMPAEKQVLGTIGAVKGATTGAVKGAAVGFVTGGKAGAAKGAAEGATRGAVGGYNNATRDYGGKRHGGGLAGNEHSGNTMAKQGEGTQRKLLHGEGGGGGIGARVGGKAKGFAKEAAWQAVTRGKGGKGGGGGAGGA